ncbi:carbohydrate ABC transporter permease [Candidatus Phytoplasma pini]|uniref:Maltose transport system permease protein MalF n=1 Tax=Candidatus Phytoplasma pini TaxID=267362 RepID=A0A559KJZ5_9MOLU|nr:sugar ABC transporter permease [Candidatus Phytoplasma pini]TVY12452.1 maltose transport system permease protein MalF [Candidatus Phytoplasma pini]
MFEIVGHKNNKHWYYLLPSLIILTIFTFYPLTKNFLISFNSSYDKFNDTFELKSFFSLMSYKMIFQDLYFKISIVNTLILVLFIVPISLTISLIIALILNSIKNLFFKNFFKTFFFLPLISNVVVMGMVFSVFFYYNNGIFTDKPEGLFNYFLSIFGIKSRNWVGFSAPSSHKFFALIFYNTWSRISFKVFVFVLALQNINKSYYDAAKVDGTSKWRIFTKITLPLLIPVIFYQFVIEILAVFKEYESIIGVLGQDADPQMQTIVMYIYNQLSSSSINSYSKGAAASIVLFFISVLFIAISFYISKKKINY